MQWTSFQKRALVELGFCKVVYKKMWKKEHALGYTTPSKSDHYDVIIAEDAPSSDVKAVVLLHEVGHVFFQHVNVDIKKELETVKDICTNLHKSYQELLFKYGGPISFLNIAMDLEVNTKLLTLGNIKTMKAANFDLCTLETCKVEYAENFRDYYKLLIQNLSDEDTLKNKQSFSDLSKLLDGMQDVTSAPSVCDGEFDSEILDGLLKESYGNPLENTSSETIRESTVDAEAYEAEKAQPTLNRMCSPEGEISRRLEVVDSSDKKIQAFLSSIIKPSKVNLPDSLKHHNRGTRRNSTGLLYTSIKRKNKADKQRLGILIDCSSSMDPSSILRSLGALKGSLTDVHSDSTVVTWNTSLISEFNITKILQSVDIGGGTFLAGGVKYLAETKKITDIVIYSDFEDDLNILEKYINESKVNVYPIVVNPEKHTYASSLVEFLEKHKKALLLKNT